MEADFSLSEKGHDNSLNVGDVALKFKCPMRFHLSAFARNTFKIQLLCTYCSNDKDSLPCRGELFTSVKYFLVASPYSQTTFVTISRVYIQGGLSKGIIDK